MAETQKEIQASEDFWLDQIRDKMMISGESAPKYKIYEERLNPLYLETIRNNIMFTKAKALDDEIMKLENRVTELEQDWSLWTKVKHNYFHVYEEEQRNPSVKRADKSDNRKTLQECIKIVGRINEILAEWCETRDIKTQIQYAAIIVAKIENMKKKEFIRADETRKKTCTLLRNVIRLNVTDNVFTREQISLLQKGFSLLLSDNVQKNDMLQLNREFWSEHLMTMPAWE